LGVPSLHGCGRVTPSGWCRSRRSRRRSGSSWLGRSERARRRAMAGRVRSALAGKTVAIILSGGNIMQHV
jgi:hypothetical protein